MSDEWRLVRHGEIVQAGDETGAYVSPWEEGTTWRQVPSHMIGKPAPDPQYPAHAIYRRRAAK
jgi:hypothetical protein